MIRKFAMILVLALLAVPCVHAQQTPDSQPSGSQESSTQQSSSQPVSSSQQSDASQQPAEEETPRRRVHPHEYRNWNFNVGAGANLTTGTTHDFVKGGGAVGEAGAARNANKYLGLRLDFLWANLPLRNSALELAQATSAHSHLYGLNLAPIINIPATKTYGGYIVIGPSFYYRSGTLGSSRATPGAPCNAFWDWWGRCTANSIALNGSFIRESVKQFGINFGGGITHKVSGKIEIYGEFRLEHGSRNNITTDFRPITIGVRW
jgi:hypothetical protein